MKRIIIIQFMLLNLASFAQTDRLLPVKIVRNDAESKVDIFIGNQFFCSYLYNASLEKPILYPIAASNESIITRGFPMNPRPGERVDHPHQVGMWFTFGDVNGVDFWNNSYAIPESEKKKYGRIIHKNIAEISTDKNKGKLAVDLDWVDYRGNILLHEKTTFLFSGTQELRFIERSCKLSTENLSVVFKDDKEGLMAVRVDRAFESPSNEPLVFIDANGKPTTVAVTDNVGKNGVYKCSSGFEADSVWGTRNKWVSLTARLNQTNISLIFFDHPSNPGYPAHAHARGYGLFSLNNLGYHAFRKSEAENNLELKPHKEVAFRYLFVIKTGSELSQKETNEISSDFESEK
jgi:hypothetical protein